MTTSKWKSLSVYLWVGLLATSCTSGVSSSGSKGNEAMAKAQGADTALSAAGEQKLRSILASGRLEDLQWPNFSDYGPFVKQFYEEAGYKLGWSRDRKPTPQALEMIALLENADEKGLDKIDYDGERWQGKLRALQDAGGDAETGLANFDVALTVSAMRYISDLHLGKVDPMTLHKDFDPERHKYELGEFLRKRVVGASSVKEVLAGVEPPFAGYQRAIEALHKYQALAKEEKLDPLPQVPKPVSPGQSCEGLQSLVHRLQFLGDLPATVSVPEGGAIYSGEVVDGVKSFQKRHGLEAAGKLGPQTITELNRPMSDRVEQLRLILERWRWVPHSFEQPPIVVNIPEFLLRAYDEQVKPQVIMPVVVGRAMRTQTPVLYEEMKYVVFWPYWNVPPSILRGELIPKIAKDPAYLQKNNYEVVTYSGQLVTDGVVSDEVLAQLRAGKLMVRQKPGPKNALGLIKFIFPNDQNVYLHSTPSPGLFAQSRRDFSHGCIRVENPAALAEWVLRNNPGWTKERIDAAFKAEKQQQVNLPSPIPVLIVYGTAVTKEDGRTYFFEDIYGYDKVLEKLFTRAYASRK
jgi:L,D-transpeptidase YcbB